MTAAATAAADDAYQQDEREAAAARHGHEVLRAYRAALGEEPGPAWEELPGVAHIRPLAMVNALAEGRGGGAEERHRRWLADRAAEGWRWAEREDRARRLSPCMRPWAALAPEQRAKDAVWCAAVLGALALLAAPALPAVEVEPVEDGSTDAVEAVEDASPAVVSAATAQPSRAERRAARKGR